MKEYETLMTKGRVLEILHKNFNESPSLELIDFYTEEFNKIMQSEIDKFKSDLDNFFYSYNRPSLLKIIDVVCKYFWLDYEELLSKSKSRSLVDARFIISHLLYNKATGYYISLENIGAFLNRDHSTILHHINEAEKLIEVDPVFRGNIIDICTILNVDFSILEGGKRLKIFGFKTTKN